jgi:LPS-assembly protein
MFPTAIGGGFYERFESSLVDLRENPPEEGTDLASKRFDAFYGLTRPLSYHGWLDFTPVVGARFTDYWDTRGATLPGGATRSLGEFGFDADLKSSATFDYKNPVWEIDGLRHLLTPTLSYRYIPDADKAADEIPPIDRSTFSTDLPIMELGDMRALDQLQAENVLRFGLNNTLQTRDPTYGSRDLLRFDVDDDLRFVRAPGQERLSELHTDLEVTPAKWLEFSAEDTFSTRSFAQKELNTNVTLREGDLWSIAAGVGYLTDNFGTYTIPGVGTYPITGLDAYHFETKVRLNEAYEAFLRVDYDDRAHLFPDQYYGVYQKLANTWIVQYTLSIQHGAGRSNGVGFNVNLEIVHF